MSSVCGCEPWSMDVNESGQILVEELDTWVDANGELLVDCATVCEEIGIYAEDVRCELNAVTEPSAPDPDGMIDISSGGAGGELNVADAEAMLLVTCFFEQMAYCEGRRHACWQSGPSGEGTTKKGLWLARAASAEAGSVESFHRLARDLKRLGAPQKFAKRAQSAAHDEVLHTRLMNKLAAENGGVTRAISFRHTEPQSLFELALENAREGCAKETFAALVGLHQAKHATDKRVSTCMRRIATDETGHGQLAWDLHQWLLTKLTSAQAARVEQTLRRSLQELSTTPFSEPMSESERRELGLPSHEVLRELSARMTERLLSAA